MVLDRDFLAGKMDVLHHAGGKRFLRRLEGIQVLAQHFLARTFENACPKRSPAFFAL